MLKKKERYATLITDLDTHRPIAVIKGRDTKDVQKFLNNLANLKYLSRDRALVYRNLDKTLCHIADQFHVLKNASDVIVKVIMSTIPSSVTVNTEDTEDAVSGIGGEKLKQQKLEGGKLKKFNLIMAVKEDYKKYGNYQELVRKYNLSRHTVKNYCDMVDPESHLLKRKKRRKVKWDEYIDEIKELLEQGYSVKKVHEKLFSNMPSYKYETLRHYCRELNIGGNRNLDTYTIDNRNIGNFIAGLNYNRDRFLSDIQKLEDEKVVTECAVLIAKLKASFDYKNINEFKSIFEYAFTNKQLINFIKGMDSDYDAIKNSIVTNYNNSIQEGMVNKVKSIKKEMYGRCGFDLLKTKILWWSIT